MKTQIQSFLIAITIIGTFLACKKDKPTDSPDTPPTSSELKITSFFPKYGVENMEVTITGTGFNAQGSEVKFGNTSATVISATSTELKVKVPSGAVKSKISVTVNGKTALSTEEFGIISTIYSKTYGGTLDDVINNIIPTADGGFIGAGSTLSNGTGDIPSGSGQTNGWIAKFSANGAVVWSKTYGGSSHDELFNIAAMPDGGYVAIGYSYSENGDIPNHIGVEDGWIIRVNSAGEVLWSKVFGGAASDILRAVRTMADGTIIAIGETFSSSSVDIPQNNGDWDGWVIKISSSGNKIWSKTFGGSLGENLFDLALNADGSMIIAGTTRSNNGDITGFHGISDGWVLKLNADGGKTLSKAYGGSHADAFYSMTPINGGGFVLIGDSESNANGDVPATRGATDGWVVRINGTDANIVWSKAYGGTQMDVLGSAVATTDGGLLLSGATSSNNSGDIPVNKGNFDGWVLKLRADNGNKEWSNNYGGNQIDIMGSVLATSDAGFIVLGSTRSNNNGDVPPNKGEQDAWVVKLGL